jgi:hypothetical protein
MKDFFIMVCLILISSVSLLSLLIKFTTKKIKTIDPKIIYIILILFPIVLVYIPIVLVSPTNTYLVENILLLIPRWIYSFEILVILVSVFIIVNIFPGSKFDNKSNLNHDLRKMASGVRILQYCIFTNILYILPISTFIMYIINIMFNSFHNSNQSIENILAFFIIWGTMLFPCFSQIYSIIGICIISIIILMLLIFITSINGTLRIVTILIKNKNKNRLIIYVILMALPVINVISMLILCYIANNKIKNYS